MRAYKKKKLVLEMGIYVKKEANIYRYFVCWHQILQTMKSKTIKS